MFFVVGTGFTLPESNQLALSGVVERIPDHHIKSIIFCLGIAARSVFVGTPFTYLLTKRLHPV